MRKESNSAFLFHLFIFLAFLMIFASWLTAAFSNINDLSDSIAISAKAPPETKNYFLSQGLRPNYRVGANGDLEIMYNKKWFLVLCTKHSWQDQAVFYKKNLADLAEGCYISDLN